jgi:hypothetical protein
MKVIMKVICLFNDNLFFTKDKIYDVILESNITGIPVYYIKKDNGSEGWVIKSNFITIEDNREQQLEKLGIL